MRRGIFSLLAGLLSASISFELFSVAYIQWAAWRYPHHNSMAGLAAFLYGFPVGGFSGLLAFAIVWIKAAPKAEPERLPKSE